MTSDVMKTQEGTERYHSRGLQIAAAAPSFLLWTMLTAIAVVWYLGTAAGAISGTLVMGDWRFPYLCVMVSLVLIGAPLTVRTLWRAIEGRSFLWWHGVTFLLGVVFLGLLGIVGD